jgi:hypothetical protein
VFATVSDTTVELDIYRAGSRCTLGQLRARRRLAQRRQTDETAERIAPLARYGVTAWFPPATSTDQLHDLKGAVRSYAISSPAHREDKLRRTNDSTF